VRVLPFLLLATLAGCAEPDVAAGPSDPAALHLLDAVGRDAAASAFERAAEARSRVDVTMWRDGIEVGRETATVVPASDGAYRLTDVTASGELAGDSESTTRGLRDPLQTALSDDPPYLDPAVREAYRIAVVGDTAFGGLRFQLVEAVLVDTTRDLGIRRVWAAVVPETGLVGAVEVDRMAASAIYDEESRVRVDLTPGPDGWRPRRVVTDTQTDVPLSAPTRIRAVWTVEE